MDSKENLDNLAMKLYTVQVLSNMTWIHALMQYFKVFSKQKSNFEVLYHQHLILHHQLSTEWLS